MILIRMFVFLILWLPVYLIIRLLDFIGDILVWYCNSILKLVIYIDNGPGFPLLKSVEIGKSDRSVW